MSFLINACSDKFPCGPESDVGMTGTMTKCHSQSSQSGVFSFDLLVFYNVKLTKVFRGIPTQRAKDPPQCSNRLAY